MPEDLYSLLGLKAGCTPDDIKQAYRMMAKRYHPDINRSAHAAELMRRINAAYAILSDAEKREAYDIRASAVRYGQPRRAGHAMETRVCRRTDASRREPRPVYSWEPPEGAHAWKNGYRIEYGPADGRARMYIILILALLLSSLYLFVLPFVYGPAFHSPDILNAAFGRVADPTIAAVARP